MAPKTLRVSFSQLSAFRQCPLKWQLQYRDRLESPKTSQPLRMGTVFHAMLAAHYRTFADADASGEARNLGAAAGAAARALEVELADEPLEEDLVDRLRWMYEGYVEYFGEDSDWEILGVEIPVDVLMAPSIRYIGYIDLLVRERTTGRVWVVDFKTGGGKDASGAAWAREMDLEDQFGLYQAAVARGGFKANGSESLRPFGTLYALIRTDRLKRPMTPEERFGRHRMFRSDETLQAIWEDAANTARAIRRAMSATGALAIYSSPDPAQCRWKCSFVDAHVMSRATGRPAAVVAREYGFVERRRREEAGK